MNKCFIKRDRNKDTYVSPDKLSKMSLEYEEEFHKILTICDKIFEDTKEADEILLSIDIEEKHLTITRFSIRMYCTLDPEHFRRNGIKCK